MAILTSFFFEPRVCLSVNGSRKICTMSRKDNCDTGILPRFTMSRPSLHKLSGGNAKGSVIKGKLKASVKTGKGGLWRKTKANATGELSSPHMRSTTKLGSDFYTSTRSLSSSRSLSASFDKKAKKTRQKVHRSISAVGRRSISQSCSRAECPATSTI